MYVLQLNSCRSTRVVDGHPCNVFSEFQSVINTIGAASEDIFLQPSNVTYLSFDPLDANELLTFPIVSV